MTSESVAFRIGSLNSDCLVVHPTRPQFEDCADYWDGNWIYATIELAAGAFRANYEACLRTEEFTAFRGQLRALHERPSGKAAFTTMEGWLNVEVEGDGKGHFRAECVARDAPGVGNALTFSLSFDQTELSEMLRSLDQICAAFPVVGAPGRAR